MKKSRARKRPAIATDQPIDLVKRMNGRTDAPLYSLAEGGSEREEGAERENNDTMCTGDAFYFGGGGGSPFLVPSSNNKFSTVHRSFRGRRTISEKRNPKSSELASSFKEIFRVVISLLVVTLSHPVIPFNVQLVTAQ